GEPYAYAHWLGQRGILAIRNPSNESRTFTLDLRLSGAPNDLADALCYVQYPYRKGVATDLSASAHLPLELAPWELMFLEVLPRSALREPVAMGTRWYADAGGSMVIAPPSTAEPVQVLLPGGNRRSLATPLQSLLEVEGKTLSQSVKICPEAERLSDKDGKRVPTTAFDCEYVVTVSGHGAQGTMLFLLEFPGRDHRLSQCSCLLNGQPVKLEERVSAGHKGAYLTKPDSPWKDVIPFESEWTWYLCEVQVGTSRLRFQGSCGDLRVRISAWVWAHRDIRNDLVPAGFPCPEPELPPYREYEETKGIRLFQG
ncbi:MAG: hypothetical protein P4N24_05665, partial [Acidobacteriota bacterium]|nr:hypothetical protein [Acidobacteriota bacterium]